MATTTVPTYDAPLVLNAEQVRELAQHWLASYRADEDVATDPVDNAFYEGGAEALEALLRAMTGTPRKDS